MASRPSTPSVRGGGREEGLLGTVLSIDGTDFQIAPKFIPPASIRADEWPLPHILVALIQNKAVRSTESPPPRRYSKEEDDSAQLRRA